MGYVEQSDFRTTQWAKWKGLLGASGRLSCIPNLTEARHHKQIPAILCVTNPGRIPASPMAPAKGIGLAGMTATGGAPPAGYKGAAHPGMPMRRSSRELVRDTVRSKYCSLHSKLSTRCRRCSSNETAAEVLAARASNPGGMGGGPGLCGLRAGEVLEGVELDTAAAEKAFAGAPSLKEKELE